MTRVRTKEGSRRQEKLGDEGRQDFLDNSETPGLS